MNTQEAQGFAGKWLPAWTGNRPEELLEFYAEDVFYLDPGIPSGVKGKAELRTYFVKLLAQNPDWVWTQIEAIPLEGGFLISGWPKSPWGIRWLNVLEYVWYNSMRNGRSKGTRYTLTEAVYWRRYRPCKLLVKPERQGIHIQEQNPGIK